MTWTWKMIRWGMGVTGTVTAATIDPNGIAGGGCGEFLKWNRFKVLNKTNERLDNREVNLRLMQLIEDYQEASIGGQVCKATGKLFRSEDKIKFLKDFGIDWVKKEIGGIALRELISGTLTVIWTQRNLDKDPLFQNIFIHYLVFTKSNKHSKTKWWVEKAIEIIGAFPRKNTYKSEVEIVIDTLKVHEQTIPYLLESPELIATERKLIWQLNEENIGLYIEKQDNLDKHQEANDLVNSCLRKLREGEERGNGETSNPYFLKSEQWDNYDPNSCLSFLDKLKSFLLNHKYEANFADKSDLKVIEKSLKKKLEKKLDEIINQVKEKKSFIEREKKLGMVVENKRSLGEVFMEKLRSVEKNVEAILTPPKVGSSFYHSL